MESELKIILAFVFKRSGKPLLSSSELVLPLAMELHWFSLKEAKAVLHLAEQRELVMKDGDSYAPSFDLKKITIPVGFVPSQKLRDMLTTLSTDHPKQSLPMVQRIVDAIVSTTGMNPADIEETINKKSDSHLLTREVAALLIAKKYEVDIQDFLPEITVRHSTEKIT
jgi:hypothetical protein